MANIQMVIDSIRVSLMHHQRVVILREKGGERYLRCWIGSAEADAISIKMQGVSVARPLTHDFICQIIDSLGGNVESVIIDKLKDDTFYAKLVINVNDVQVQIDCRPSDALAVAIRKGVPIFAEDTVLNKAGTLLDTETEKPFKPSSEEVAARQNSVKGHLEAFSESVRDLLDTAEIEAKRLNQNSVCTGHLLLALAKEVNTATEVLKNAGVNFARIQLDIETSMKEGQDIEGGETGLTPAVKQAIQTAIAEAKRLGSEEVLPEHILLGLVRANDGIASNWLKSAGINPETVYVELIRLYT